MKPHVATDGFRVAQGSGLWKGLWYVSEAITTVNLRAQVSRKYRPDGTRYPVLSPAQVATACASPASLYAVNHCMNDGHAHDFRSFYSFAWAHERMHLAAAQSVWYSQPDLYEAWGTGLWGQCGRRS